ncbi:hypothetical protein C2W62_35790 [Candidatus Entotheonella serta]|nr:hypothetical protein C2W62_35790 [Candidatus Entotheonella serta]
MMCGIVGLAGFRDDKLLRHMANTIAHRGPDDSGVYGTAQHSIAVQRLSIIDLTTGHQPMTACGGRVAIGFNGELYNYRDIRTELVPYGHRFQTQSDTEVVLKAYLQWGIGMLGRFNGMFAIAISDQRDVPVLYVIRDRLGIKPLYYHFRQGHLTFASELKALLVDRTVARTLNPVAVDDYLRYRYVPGDVCLIQRCLEAFGWRYFEVL